MQVGDAMTEGRRLFKCGYCGKVFTTNSNWRRHERTHTGEKRHKCTDCAKTFSRKEDLKIHRNNLHGCSETHECWICGKLLGSYRKLELHTCLHTGERPHSCNVCRKGYISLRGLKAHMRSHESTSEQDTKAPAQQESNCI